MKHLNQSLGDLFAQPKAAGRFMPGVSMPNVTSGSPLAATLRDSYQSRGKGRGHGTQVTIPSTYYGSQEQMEPDGVGDGNNSLAGNRFPVEPSTPMPTPVPTPTGTPTGTPRAAPAPKAIGQPVPKDGQTQRSQPANPPSIYENGMYWKLLG